MTTDYTDAPATDLLATRCCACGRPLLDAVSVELGIGPVCRSRAGLDGEGTGADWPRVLPLLGEVEPVEGDARATANRVVHRIACDQGAASVPAHLAALEALGFAGVAKAVRDHLRIVTPTVRVDLDGGRYAVRFEGLDRPTFDALVAALRSVPGRWFDGARKVNVIPSRERRALWTALTSTLPAGALVVGPNGVNVIARAA